ncbi:MAG: hypothetical protein WBN94_09900 [Methanothrix sp.]
MTTQLEEAKKELKRTLSSKQKLNEAGVVTVDLTDEDLERFWESYLEVKENEAQTQVEKEAARQRVLSIKANSKDGSALQRAKKELKQTLSRQQIREERL